MSNHKEGLLPFDDQDSFSLSLDEHKISGLKLLNGTSNASLARKVAQKLNVDMNKSTVRRFADNELFVEIHENVRGSDAFILQPTSKPANDHLLELLIMTDALRRASARRITAVIPYFGYARQDRKTAARTPISAKLIANLIDRAGVDRVLTLDLHAGQIQGYFDIPVDNLYASPLFGRDIKRRFFDKQVMIVSPDVGGVARAREIATRVGAPLSIVDKRRDRPGSSEVMNVIGNVDGYHCILIDDIIDSGGTICNAAKALLDQGAVSVSAYCTHGVLSDRAVERIEQSYLQELTITDSIEATQAVSQSAKVRILSVSSLLAEAIYRTHTDDSVSSLFI